ncbi:MAG TPA: hypothetical protein VL654_04435 [Casimicrobiaceae bacterium]|jgi:hypothetical protein|nr:hypothetical protein [Casimicrobiaceae bacterium]
MNERMHVRKAERIERSLGLLDVEAFEAVIEGAMLAGTHWFNVLLHRAGVAAENADAMHAEFLTAGIRRKVAVLMPGALAALDEIETLRTTHVRGDMPDGSAAARRALACLARLREEATKRSAA